MRNTLSHAIITAAGVLASGLPISALAMDPLTLPVDCGRGSTITKALSFTDLLHRPLVLAVRGTCNENVTITRDDVTLQGAPGASVSTTNASQPAINVKSATRVLIDGLTVNGGSFGIAVGHTLDVSITNSVIQNSTQNGINVIAGHVKILNSTIQNAGNHGVYLLEATALLSNSQIRSNAGSGLYLEDKSAVRASGNTISSNGASGVSLYGDSYGKLVGSNTITANGTNPALTRNGVDVNQSSAEIYNGINITNHPWSGVAAALSKVQIAGSTISGNLGGGIFGYLGSVIVVNNGTVVTGNQGLGVLLSTNSTGQITGATIQNNTNDGIRLLFGSKLEIGSPTSDATGNGGFGLNCSDAESSVNGLAWLVGSVSPSCTGY
jgi:parallel beta-helix repeat protein